MFNSGELLVDGLKKAVGNHSGLQQREEGGKKEGQRKEFVLNCEGYIILQWTEINLKTFIFCASYTIIFVFPL